MNLFSRWFSRVRAPAAAAGPHEEGTPPRRLFLDDDPARAEVFLAENPGAVWVHTVPECLERLEESWDEVHLDHDLGGEYFVDHARDDCGMEVVRRLASTGRAHPHLRRTRFYVHSHNPVASTEMAMSLMNAGYFVELRPFGSPPLPPLPEEPPPPGGRLGAIVRRLGQTVLGRRPDPVNDFGYDGAGYGCDDGAPERLDLDLDWARTGVPVPRRTPGPGPASPGPDRGDGVVPDAPPPSEAGPPYPG